MSEQHEQRRQEEKTPTFPWRDLRQWLSHVPGKLWQGVKAVWHRLKEIPPHRRKTYLAIAGMVCLLMLGAAVLGLVIGSIGLGILFVIAVTAVWLAVIYFKGNSILPLLSGARPAKEEEYPELVSMVRELSQTAELPMPAFWIAENPEVNAFACGRDSAHAAIVVFTGGLDIWKGEEIRGILAHEVAHIKNRDVLLDTFMRAILNGMQWSAILFMKPFEWMMRFFALFVSEDGQGGLAAFSGFMVLCLSSLLRALDFLFGAILLPATQLIQMAASRQQEYFADATGAQLAGSPNGLTAALAKLHVMELSLSSASHQNVRGVQGLMEQLWSTHPPTEERVQRLGGALFAAGSKEASELLARIEKTPEQTAEPQLDRSPVSLDMAQQARREVLYGKGGDMEYKVVPVDLDVLEQLGPPGAAREVQAIINQEASRGWEFISLENIEIVVTDPGNKGCFGIGATPQTSRITRFDMAVFRK